MRTKFFVAGIGVVALLGTGLPGALSAEPSGRRAVVAAPGSGQAVRAPGSVVAPPTGSGAVPTDDTRHPGIAILKGTLPVVQERAEAAAPSAGTAAAAADPTVGEVRNWLALDDAYGVYYRKQYTLRALRDNVEVWVASEANRVAPAAGGVTPVGMSSGTGFLDGDCRNPRTQITDQQAGYLADEFQNNILPKESGAFSVAPDRDGTNAIVPAPTYNPAGPGQRTVVLVDNVRDGNFYDRNNAQGLSFIAGFFSSQLNALFDRNIMTIDGFDWLHRTGATPPNEPVPGDNCLSAPARPFAYEGVFAHEYQHLLESYADPDESTWINEGLSDWAETLTGYITPSTPITTVGFDSHTQCFLGYLSMLTPANPNPRLRGGPENSLTRWSDQSDAEILCDYGAAYTFMEFVAGRYGVAFMTALHRGEANGLPAVQKALDATGHDKEMAIDVMHAWSVMLAVDGLLDSGARLRGTYRPEDVNTPTLKATINWDTPEAYSSPGAPSNGSDYVRLRDDRGYLKGDDIESLSFKGATTLPTKPVAWKVDPNPPGHTGDPSLYSDFGDSRDEAIVRQVSVPAGAAATLGFDARWNQEEGWDYGFVQVSTDAGSTYTSVACTDTTMAADPGAIAIVAANLPGYTGDSAGWRPQTCDLSAYAGTTVLLAFRAINDPNTLGTDPAIAPGFWVDDIKLGGAAVGDGSLAGWKSFTEIRPNSVSGYVVNIISIEGAGGRLDTMSPAELAQLAADADSAQTAGRADGEDDADQTPAARADNARRADDDRRNGRRGPLVTVTRLPLTADFQIRGRANVRRFVKRNADFVAAIVTYDDPTETSDQYAPYTLTVNGVAQPGGK